MNKSSDQPTNAAHWDVLNSRSNTLKWLLALYRNGAYHLAPSEV